MPQAAINAAVKPTILRTRRLLVQSAAMEPSAKRVANPEAQIGAINSRYRHSPLATTENKYAVPVAAARARTPASTINVDFNAPRIPWIILSLSDSPHARTAATFQSSAGMIAGPLVAGPFAQYRPVTRHQCRRRLRRPRTGASSALNIDVHSGFNISKPAPDPRPIPR